MKIRHGGGLVLAAAIALYLLLGSVDQRLKHAPHPGFTGDFDWQLDTADAPRFWDRLKTLPQARALQEEIPDVLKALELAVYRATWIRPSPARWRVWLGPRLLLSGHDDTWAACVHPGLMLRAAHAINRLSGGTADNEIYRYGGLFYTWREGFFLFSPSASLVKMLQQNGTPTESDDAPGADEAVISLTLDEDTPLSIHLRAEAKMPVQIAMPWPNETRQGLSFTEAWPDRPLLAFSTSDVALLAQLAQRIYDVTAPAEWPGWSRTLFRDAPPPLPIQHVPGTWKKNIVEFSGALLNLDTSETLPVPEVALALRMTPDSEPAHPLAFMAGPAALPYFWNDSPGQLLPLLGEKWTLCLAGEGTVRFAASQEPVMTRLTGRFRPGLEAPLVMALRIDWERCAAIAADLVRKAAALELIPQKDGRDADRLFLPWLRLVGRLGQLRLDARLENGELLFTGELAAPFGEETP